MSSEFDKDIDSLLREGARRVRGSSYVERSATRHADGGVRATPSGAHLDADELNAYAENALPSVARAHHTAHLADCDDCRRSVTALALAAGMPAQLEQREAATAEAARQKVTTNAGWRERLGAFFAPSAWRYAVPALALLLVGAVSLVVFMRGRQSGTETSLARRNASEGAKPSLAQTEQHHATQQNNNAADSTTAATNGNAANSPNSNATAPFAKEGVVVADNGSVREEQSLPKSGVVTNAGAPPLQQPLPAPATGSGAVARAITEMPAPTPPPVAEPVTVAQDREAKVKSAESVVEVAKDASQKQADYEAIQREQAANARRMEKLGGPRRNSNNEQARNSRAMNAGDSPERADKNDESVATTTAPAAPRAAAAKRTRQRDADDEKDNAAKPSDSSLKSESRRAPESSSGETRSVGGRRFRKQGGAWVDTAYNAGQSYTVVRRNSEQYRALVADEPAIGRIADALGGEVTIVWKGRAYRIR
jgi:hypothetical protein